MDSQNDTAIEQLRAELERAARDYEDALKVYEPARDAKWNAAEALGQALAAQFGITKDDKLAVTPEFIAWAETEYDGRDMWPDWESDKFVLIDCLNADGTADLVNEFLGWRAEMVATSAERVPLAIVAGMKSAFQTRGAQS